MKRIAFAALMIMALPLRAEDAQPVTDPAVVAQHYHQVAAQPQYADVPDEDGVEERMADWFTQWLRHLGDRIENFKYATKMPAVESLLMTMLVLFSVSVLVYVLMRLTRRRATMELERSSDAPSERSLPPPEFYDEEISSAVKGGDWHSAWLAAWRQFLSRLERRQLVDPDRTRTNREYLAQLRNKALPPSALGAVSGMVDAYDRIIYGHAPLGQTEWEQFNRTLDETALQLHLETKRSAPTRSAA